MRRRSRSPTSSPLALAEDFGVDPLRYHLLRDVPLGSDGDFSYEGIVARYNADLANNLGNLVSRVTTVVHSKCGGIGPAPDASSELAAVAAGVLEAASNAWARWAPHDALEETWRLIGAANAGLEAAEPWKMEPGPAVDAVLGDALEVLRIVAILVAPAMPATAAEVWRRIGLEGDPDAARLPADAAWGGYRGRDGRGEGGAAVPPPQGLTWAGWFDSHCHVQEEYLGRGEAADPEGELDAEALLARAAEAGVDRLICIGTGPATSVQALEVARATEGPGVAPRAWASIGLHPHEASEGVDEVAALIDRVVREGDPSLVAIGECGLDYYYEHSPRDAQRAAFAAQIALAREHDLALVIHARDAWDDIFDVLAGEGVPARTVLHCFTGGPDEVDRCLARRHVRLVQRDRHVQERSGRTRRSGAVPTGAPPGRNRQPLPRAGAASRPDQRAVVRAVGRRSHRGDQAVHGRRGERTHRGVDRHGVFHRGLIPPFQCVIREPSDLEF